MVRNTNLYTVIIRRQKKERETDRRGHGSSIIINSVPPLPLLLTTSPHFLKFLHFPIIPQTDVQDFNMWACENTNPNRILFLCPC